MHLHSAIDGLATLLIVSGAVIILYIIYALGIAIYNVTLHPLAKFPGPKLWAAFSWPYSLSTFSGSEATDLHTLHEKHGKIVRVNPTTLSFTDGQVWKGAALFR
jgi:hypothetical protein